MHPSESEIMGYHFQTVVLVSLTDVRTFVAGIRISLDFWQCSDTMSSSYNQNSQTARH